MKRGAEKQIIREDADDDDIEEVEPGQGFKKADEKVLAGRTIRGLPKRSLAGSLAPTPAPVSDVSEPNPTPKFAGFSGFGSATPFSFAPPQETSTFPKPPPVAPMTTPSSVFSASAPSVSSSASNATKTFASFLGAPAPISALPETKSPSPPQGGDDIGVETKYLTALRGLNVSFLSAVSKAVESDPFLDVADLLERYKALRITVKSEYDDNLKKLKTPNTSTPLSLPTPPSAFSFGGSTIKPTSSTDAKPTNITSAQSAPSMPIPPTSFSGFPAFGVPSSTASGGGGFVPKADSSSGAGSSLFSFGTSASSSSDNKSSSAPTKSAFSFDKPASTSPAPSPSPFSFGNASSGSKPGAASLIFGPSSSSSAPSVFTSNLFGKPDSSKDEEAKSSGTGRFGQATSVFGTSNKPTTNSSTSSPFSFGSNAPSANPAAAAGTGTGTAAGIGGNPSPFGGFGKGSSGGFGNSVGFHFGSPLKTLEAETTSFPSSPKSSAFSFGVQPVSSSSPTLQVPDSDKDKDGESSVATSLEGTPAAEERPASNSLITTSVHDMEGEGEEDEETAHEVRSKVYKMVKMGDGSQEWSDMGVGFLRIKKHKETGSRRLLLRNSSTGKIVINFNIYTGMNPVASKNVVSLVGHDHSDLAATRGSATPFKLRVKTELQAKELKEALDKAIGSLPGKSD